MPSKSQIRYFKIKIVFSFNFQMGGNTFLEYWKTPKASLTSVLNNYNFINFPPTPKIWEEISFLQAI